MVLHLVDHSHLLPAIVHLQEDQVLHPQDMVLHLVDQVLHPQVIVPLLEG